MFDRDIKSWHFCPSSPFYSPVKFSPGDFWGRGTTAGATNAQATADFRMETSVEQMDVTVSGEASAPLPIRQSNAGPYKKQTYPLIPKRPEHLRMNLWHYSVSWHFVQVMKPRNIKPNWKQSINI